MRDARTTLANGRVADRALSDVVQANRYVEPTLCQGVAAVADILDAPGGGRVSQLLYGERFAVIELRAGHAFGQCQHDGYVGYVDEAALGPAVTPTHWVAALATNLYPAPEVKARAGAAAFLGAPLRVLSRAGDFQRLHDGRFAPAMHVQPRKVRFADLAGVAEMFLGAPYLWGGRTVCGIDCSGLVQAACLACGIDCPRDTDMQAAALGRALDKGEPLRRGDLVFWKGHVGIMTDSRRLLHANAYHMAVAHEPVIEAMRRIEATETGPVTARRRV